MGLFKKKADPLSERARALNAEIAALEAQIKKLGSEAQKTAPQPRLRSTVAPPPPHSNGFPAAGHPHANGAEPVFEANDFHRTTGSLEPETEPPHFNELGLRKFDLAALLRRWQSYFHGPSTRNPKLVSYLAAGSIKGLRPLRYEKRVARNRFIALLVILVLIVWGIAAVLFKR